MERVVAANSALSQQTSAQSVEMGFFLFYFDFPLVCCPRNWRRIAINVVKTFTIFFSLLFFEQQIVFL